MHSYYEGFSKRDWTRYNIRPEAWGKVRENERVAWAAYVKEFTRTPSGMWSHVDGRMQLLIADQRGTPLTHARIAAEFAEFVFSPAEFFALCESIRFAVAWDDVDKETHGDLFSQWFKPEDDGRLTFAPNADAWCHWRMPVMLGQKTPEQATKEYFDGTYDWRSDLEWAKERRRRREASAEEA